MDGFKRLVAFDTERYENTMVHQELHNYLCKEIWSIKPDRCPKADCQEPRTWASYWDAVRPGNSGDQWKQRFRALGMPDNMMNLWGENSTPILTLFWGMHVHKIEHIEVFKFQWPCEIEEDLRWKA
eukprot:TRINITY_DN121580_c0_g1_i1.p1 TRINITY_DN121580_c0_g1~~TRINITY_DN121580_c0_g1_i1.p1  ORF type:complete len:148 (-),score=18.58 TRINITY_DN121580_c0_g1_i1:38-415(-)